MTTTEQGRRVPERTGRGESIVDGAAATVLSWGWATDTGRRRTRNEDAVLADRTLFFVADGMGGHAHGDLASRTALAEVALLAGREEVGAEDCAQAVRCAAESVAGIDRGPRGAAGTTLSGAVVTANGGRPYWLVVNVGDSRTYLWRGGRLEQITVDHSAVRELVDAGEISPEQARVHPERNVITRAIGSGLDPRADVWMLPRHPGDLLLACSDGVTGEIDDDELVRLLREAPDPGTLAAALVASAVEAGGRDNASAVVVAVGGVPDDSVDITEELPRPFTEEDTR